MKWYTIIKVIDITTGEVHEKNINMEEWIKINKSIKYEINENQTQGTRKIDYECRPRGKQLQLEFDEI